MDNDNDIFKKAAENSARESLERAAKTIEDTAKKIKETPNIMTQSEIAEYQVAKGDKWDNLAEYINGEGAERLLLELKNMGGKDFTRNYLKLLEHFKPKLTRSDHSPEDEADRTITVELVQQLPSGEKRVITMNSSNKD